MNGGGGGEAGGLQPPKFWAGGEIWANSVFTKVLIFLFHFLISIHRFLLHGIKRRKGTVYTGEVCYH